MKKLLCLLLCLSLCFCTMTLPAFASEAVSDAEHTLYTAGYFQYEAPASWAYTQENGQNNHIYALEGEGVQNMLFAASISLTIPSDQVTQLLASSAIGTEGYRKDSIEWMTIDGCTAATFVTTQTFYEKDVAMPYLLCAAENTVLYMAYASPFVSDEETISTFRQIISTVRLSDLAKSFSAQSLQNLSLAELTSLQNQISAAARNTDEWQEVTVPIGLYKIGEDIPAGHWTVKAADGVYTYLEYGDVLEKSGKEIDYLASDVYISDFIYSPSRRTYDPNSDIVQYDILLKDGYYLHIDSGSAVFTPYAGKPSPQFEASVPQGSTSAQIVSEEGLSALPLDTLAELHRKVTLAMWETGEWTKVTVPIGVYEIGADIPAGHWKIEAADDAYISLEYGDVLDESGRAIDLWKSNICDYETVKSPSRSTYNPNSDISEYDLNLKDGCYLIIEDGFAVFSPYTGKSSLGFK